MGLSICLSLLFIVPFYILNDRTEKRKPQFYLINVVEALFLMISSCCCVFAGKHCYCRQTQHVLFDVLESIRSREHIDRYPASLITVDLKPESAGTWAIHRLDSIRQATSNPSLCRYKNFVINLSMAVTLAANALAVPKLSMPLSFFVQFFSPSQDTPPFLLWNFRIFLISSKFS